jgi:hypothetical protein
MASAADPRAATVTELGPRMNGAKTITRAFGTTPKTT